MNWATKQVRSEATTRTIRHITKLPAANSNARRNLGTSSRNPMAGWGSSQMSVGHPEPLPDQEGEEHRAGNDPDQPPDLLDRRIVPGEPRRGAGEYVIADIRARQGQQPRPEFIIGVTEIDQGAAPAAVVELPDFSHICNRFRDVIAGDLVAQQPQLLRERPHLEGRVPRDSHVGGYLEPVGEPRRQRHVVDEIVEGFIMLLRNL